MNYFICSALLCGSFELEEDLEHPGHVQHRHDLGEAECLENGDGGVRREEGETYVWL